ncbi:MAG TPA: cation diffusion facilitator family transporter [Allosphingosinicella sp.]|jgi:cation diffusion facilitator family transporter
MRRTIPPEIEADLKRAVRLEWWTIAWMASIIVLIGLAMGSSQAMKTAWIEDVLSLVPSLVFLLAVHFERKPPTARFPYGYQRVTSLAFLVAAVALAVMGSVLLVESILSLAKAEHVTVPPVRLLGQEIWLGWLMIAALAYSTIPPVILGRMKLPLARRLQDEVLHTDALMQKADWMTGLAGIAGIIGIGLGYWWADAVAAGIISFSILTDGVTALRIAVAELADGAPRELGSTGVEEEALALEARLSELYPGGEVQLRDSGRYILANVCGVPSPGRVDLDSIWPGRPDRSWRFAQLSFAPPSIESDEAAA